MNFLLVYPLIGTSERLQEVRDLTTRISILRKAVLAEIDRNDDGDVLMTDAELLVGMLLHHFQILVCNFHQAIDLLVSQLYILPMQQSLASRSAATRIALENLREELSSAKNQMAVMESNNADNATTQFDFPFNFFRHRLIVFISESRLFLSESSPFHLALLLWNHCLRWTTYC